MSLLSKSVVEGRAVLARPSLRYLLVSGLLVLGISASSAVAAPLRPALTATDPGSPGMSLTPRIQGHGDGIITSGFPRSSRLGGPRTSDFEPGAIVTIYA